MYGPEMHRTVAVSTVSACLASQGGALGGRRSTTLPVWGGYRYGRQTRRKAGRLAQGRPPGALREAPRADSDGACVDVLVRLVHNKDCSSRIPKSALF